jgi:Flp pilus assembly pilin Flp
MKKLRSFSHHIKGATAVEFAIVAAPFFAILLAIIEIAAVFWVNGALIEAVSQPARAVLVGETIDKNRFKTLICEKASPLVECDKLVIDVRSFKSFAEVGRMPLFDPITKQPLPVSFDPGKGGDIILVRVAYAYPLIVPWFHNIFFDLSNIDNKHRLILATNVFKNEPYND